MLFSCESDLVQEDIAPETPVLETLYFDINDLSAGAKSKTGLEAHVLGPERQNPLTVARLAEAELAMKGTSTPRSASDYYIKFQPADADDLRELEEADLFLLDFPWTREIIEQKDYYQSANSSTDYPDLYTTMNVNATIPDVPHVIIDQLDLAESDPVILEKAFQSTGNGAEFLATYGVGNKSPDICLENPTTAFQLCGGGGGGGSQFITNECGCQIFANQRKPGGTVKVDDTQFNMDFPVRRVRVVAKNNWFSWRVTNTDDNGCWRINREFSGKAWFWVKFKDEVSDRVRIRFAGVRGWRFWQRAFTGSVYLGRKAGPNFNNILTRFGRWSHGSKENLGTKVHYAWAGATINNALHEFHDLSASEGFIPPPDDLNMLINLRQRGGFTTMLRQMGMENFISAVDQGYRNREINAVGADLSNAFDQALIDATGTPEWPQQAPILSTFMGDVNTGAKFATSDSMKRLAFHEIGHASHYEGSSVNFHRNLIAASVGAGGHGNPNVILAGHLQVAESWVEHMARSMLIQKYPLPGSTNSCLFGDWSEDLERVANESLNHIPIGVYNDLIDPVNNSESVYDENERRLSLSGNVFVDLPDFEPLIDPVSGGYTNSFFAQIMDANTTSPADLRNRCIQNLPVGVTASGVNILFNQYE